MEIRRKGDRRAENTGMLKSEWDNAFLRREIFNVLYPGSCSLCLLLACCSSPMETTSNCKGCPGWPFVEIKEREEIPPLNPLSVEHRHDLHECKMTRMELIQEELRAKDSPQEQVSWDVEIGLHKLRALLVLPRFYMVW